MAKSLSQRAGVLRRQSGGFDAFIPKPFPPNDLALAPLGDLLERATLSLGKVGSAEILPNPNRFVFMYVRREAVLSSQIEGTEASLVDLLNTKPKQIRPSVSPLGTTLQRSRTASTAESADWLAEHLSGFYLFKSTAPSRRK